jgi:MFS family permease
VLVFSGAVLGTYAAVAIGGEVLSRGFGALLATACVAVLAAGNAAGRLSGGAASDRLGVDLVLLTVFLLDLAAAASLFTGVSALGAPLAALAAGLALGGSNGTMARLGAQAAPDAPNSAFGLIFAAYASGSVLGPVGGSLVGPPNAWLLTGAPALLGLGVLAWRGRRSVE